MQPDWGTAIYGVIAPKALIIAADSRIQIVSHSPEGWPTTFDKLRIIKGQVIVGCEGMGIMRPSLDVKYTFQEWMTQVEDRLTGEVNARSVAATIKKELAEPFNKLCRDHPKCFSDYQSGKGHVVSFLIGSNSHTISQLIQLTASLKRPEGGIEFAPNTYSDGPAPSGDPPRKGLGRVRDIDKAFLEDGAPRHHLNAVTKGKFDKLRLGDELSLDELRDTVCHLIRLEAELNEKCVGPPYLVGSIEPGGRAVLLTYKR